MPRFELVIVQLNGSVTRHDFRTLQAAREEMMGSAEATFKCVLHYFDDEDMKPSVVARTF